MPENIEIMCVYSCALYFAKVGAGHEQPDFNFCVSVVLWDPKYSCGLSMISREKLRVLLNIHWPSWRNLAGSVAADSLVLVGRACGPCAPIHSAVFDPRNWHRCGKYQASCLICKYSEALEGPS